MTEKEIRERLEKDEESSENRVSKPLTVNDLLDKLEEETLDNSDNKEVQITLFPPVVSAIDSDGDSDDENAPTCLFSHLSRKLLEAEGEIQEADKTCDSQDEIEEDLGVFPSPSSSKANNNNTNNNNSRVVVIRGKKSDKKKIPDLEAEAGNVSTRKTLSLEAGAAEIGGKKGVKKTSSLEAEEAKIGGKKGVKKTSSGKAEEAKVGGKKGVKKTSDYGRSSNDDSLLPTNGGGDTDVVGAPILGPAMRKSAAKKIRGKKGDKKNGVTDKENQPPEIDFDLMPPPAAVVRSLPAGRGRRKGTMTGTSSGQASPSDDSDEDNDDEDLESGLRAIFGSTVRVVPVRRGDQTGKTSRRNAAKSSESVSGHARAQKRKATPESESGHDENAQAQKRRATAESESDYDENISRRRTRSQGDVEEDDSEEDDEENNSKQSKRGRKGNPEYSRVWSNTDTGVGSKIGEFDPPPNDSNSEEVKNIKSPYDAWRLFLPDEFIEVVLEQSRIYAHQEGFGRKAAEMTKDNLLCVLAVMLLSGYNILPDKRMYWERQPDCYNELVADNIRRDTFTSVLQCLHFTNNTLTTEDRFYKVRPLFESLNKQSLKYLPTPRNLSVDETMIPYYGSHGDKQYIRNKPIR